MERAEIRHGEKIDISNARGGSGHNMNPFAIVCNENANENYGEAIGFSQKHIEVIIQSCIMTPEISLPKEAKKYTVMIR